MRLGIFGIIAVAFLALEMVGMYLLAREIGTFHVLLCVLAALVAGVWVIRHAGSGFQAGLLAAVRQGHTPFGILWITGRRFLAGALLVFPGIVSDLMALILLFEPGPRRPPVQPQGRDDGIIEGEFRRKD